MTIVFLDEYGIKHEIVVEAKNKDEALKKLNARWPFPVKKILHAWPYI